jgi:hypothetical protein
MPQKFIVVTDNIILVDGGNDRERHTILNRNWRFDGIVRFVVNKFKVINYKIRNILF